MNDVYWDIFVVVPSDSPIRELLIAEFFSCGFTGFMEEERGVHCYVPREKENEAMQQVNEFCERNGLVVSESVQIENQNWNEQWEKTIQPIHVTDRIIITPSWHPLPDEAGRIVLTIDPKMSFGTGYHESTRLMLRLMEQHIRRDMKVLDVGTGTGVLAIAAVKLGATSAIGIDIDEWAQANAEENVRRNGLADVVTIRRGSLEVVRESGLDLVLANIQRMTILDLLPIMLEKLSSSGVILLSGLVVEDQVHIERAFLSHCCRILTILRENNWIAIAGEKR